MAAVEDEQNEKEFMLRGYRYAYHADDKQWQEFVDTMFRAPGEAKPKIKQVDPKVARRNWMTLARGLRGKGKGRK